MEVIMEFATPVGMFYTEEKDLTTDIFEKITNITEQDTEVFKYLDQSKTTPDDLHLQDFFKPLVTYIHTKVDKFSAEVLGINSTDIKLSSMWSNVHEPGSKHHPHQHPNSFLSGVYYPYIPECKDPGNIIFIDPRHAKNMVHADFVKSSCISNRQIWVTPKTGLLLLFPSWLEHGTEPFIGKQGQKRTAISFNYQLTLCTQKTMRIL